MHAYAWALMTLLAATPSPAPLLSSDDRQFLEDITRATVEASRVAPDAKVGGVGPNATGGTLIRPGGRDCYPAFWIRDYAMSLDCGLIPPAEQLHALLLTADKQQDVERQLPTGGVVPAGAIADHIAFGGQPIFYPGVLDNEEIQGDPKFGRIPCLDDQFFFVHMAAAYVRDTGDFAILDRVVREKPLRQRLVEAFNMPPSRPDTHLVYADADNRGVNFGFFDTVVHTGDLLFASVLKYQAAQELRDLFGRAGDADGAARYRDIAEALRRAIPATFALDSGLLKASTGIGAQPDVWGTAYAVYTGALEPEARRNACQALTDAYTHGTIAWQGMIRHVPTDADFSATTAWETAYAPLNTYQNGAYWGTATGWIAYALAQVDRSLAARLFGEYVAHLRADDFRQGPDHGAPWECMHPDNNHRQNPVYMASVTCPLTVLQRLER